MHYLNTICIFIDTYKGCYYTGIACLVSDKPTMSTEIGGFCVQLLSSGGGSQDTPRSAGSPRAAVTSPLLQSVVVVNNFSGQQQQNPIHYTKNVVYKEER